MATGCAQQYEPPGGVGAGPDPLSVCQWDMRIMNASPTGSYAVNRGQGATVAILDTGVDYTHPDIAPNFDLARSCWFIYAGNPAADPRDLETPGSCATKTAVQDYFGQGAHVAGIVAAPINGIGVAGVAPEATVASLKVCTTVGYCFTQPVADALIYAGDQGFDVANMSFFADPWLFNCKNDADQRAIVKAISRAAQYAPSVASCLSPRRGTSPRISIIRGSMRSARTSRLGPRWSGTLAMSASCCRESCPRW
jgi:subtilisin family serine protease